VCTASWLRRDGALRLLFNRDELRSREAALPPAILAGAGGRWIAPRDGRAGGTWIAAGERGVVLALLNRSAGLRPESAASRGLLIPELLPAANPEELVARLAQRDLAAFAPFRLLALWRDLPLGVVAGWDGAGLDAAGLDTDAGLLCSSSLGDERVTATRGAVWQSQRLAAPDWDGERHGDFHRDHTPEPSAWSVCMHRDDAQSVSLTAVEIGRREIRLTYHDAPPCQPGADHELRLPAAAAALAG
jgi:hypothetical protein